jgi:hypothetical protein
LSERQHRIDAQQGRQQGSGAGPERESRLGFTNKARISHGTELLIGGGSLEQFLKNQDDVGGHLALKATGAIPIQQANQHRTGYCNQYNSSFPAQPDPIQQQQVSFWPQAPSFWRLCRNNEGYSPRFEND